MTKEDILVLCRAIPEHSRSYFRTVCVAGVNSQNKLRRLYPVPFKPFAEDGGIPFHKKEWVTINVKPPQSNDKREESRKVVMSSAQVTRKADNDEVRRIIRKLIRPSVKAVENSGASLGFIKPMIIGYEVKIKDTNLYDDQRTLTWNDLQQKAGLIKLPQESLYEFTCEDPRQCSCSKAPHRMEIHDWEVNELYRNIVSQTKDETVIREKMKEKFLTWMTSKEDIYFMIGNHFVWKTWMIVSVIYLPKVKYAATNLEDFPDPVS